MSSNDPSKLLNFRRASELSMDNFVSDGEVVEGCCEFVRGRVFGGSSGRVCSLDKSICPERIYSDEPVYLRCFLRLRELSAIKKKNSGGFS